MNQHQNATEWRKLRTASKRPR